MSLYNQFSKFHVTISRFFGKVFRIITLNGFQLIEMFLAPFDSRKNRWLIQQGEWTDAGGIFPFILSGWEALPGDVQYQSQLVKDGQVVTSRVDGMYSSQIVR